MAGDVKMRGLERRAEPQVYLPFRQVADGNIIGYIPRALIVRTVADPAALAAPIRAVIRQIEPTLPVTDVATMTEVVERDTASRSAQVRVLAAFAVIAFVLAGIGIHGLLSFSVSQRAQEIGVRMALGAQSGDILRMIVRRSVMLALAGVIPGVALAYVAGRSMEALLAGVEAGRRADAARRRRPLGADDDRRQRDADAARAPRRSDHGAAGGIGSSPQSPGPQAPVSSHEARASSAGCSRNA